VLATSETEIDRDTKTMDVTYTFDPGPVMRFGPVAITGLERLNPAYVEGRVRWQGGEIYDASKVTETRRALIETGLFSTVQITPTADPEHAGEARMTIDATERVHRTIGAGLAYNTSQGFGARAFWENRNLFGNAENLRLSAEVGQQLDVFRANFRRPDFLAIDQDFLATAEVANDTPVAYNSRRELATVGIERRLDHWLTGGLSLLAEKANVTQLANVTPMTGTQHYELAGLPAYVKLASKGRFIMSPRSKCWAPTGSHYRSRETGKSCRSNPATRRVQPQLSQPRRHWRQRLAIAAILLPR
jgi:translocation and assembly module TamA